MIVIGSHALAIYDKDRVPKDWDLICTTSEMMDICKDLDMTPVKVNNFIWKAWSKQHGQIEFELMECSQSGQFYNRLMRGWTGGSSMLYVPGYGYAQAASPSILFSIKRSHIFYPREWAKHIKDYHFLKNLIPLDVHPEITAIRRKELEQSLGELKTPSLKQTAEDFFDDNVSNKTFIHDEIHQVMAHREKPMFEYIKLNPDQVACSNEKFYELNQFDRIKCVIEEAYVIALERAIIPMLYEGKKYATPIKSFEWAMMRICTTLCSGWFREFAVENYPSIMNYYDRKYVNKFLIAVDEGRIKRI